MLIHIFDCLSINKQNTEYPNENIGKCDESGNYGRKKLTYS